MLLLDCPWCGPRNEPEFRYGGQAHVPHPVDPDALDDRQWAEYLFYRDNPRGLFAERWSHAAGCRRWFHVLRDTATYRVAATYRPDEDEPAVARGTAPPVRTSRAPELQAALGAGGGR